MADQIRAGQGGGRRPILGGMAQGVGQVDSRGVYDGFEAFRTSTDDDYKRLFTTGLVVPDANVLLNLYRYKEDARETLMRVLRRLGDRLWVPHQVLAEFWRNRDSAIEEPHVATKNAIEALDKCRHGAIQAVRTLANRVVLPAEEQTRLTKSIGACFDEIARDLDDDVPGDLVRDTNRDKTLIGLSEVLLGRVGAPLPDDERRKAVLEARRRADDNVPPGYKDSDKEDDDRAAGDYLVWYEVLREAKRRSCDVLIVTGDLKEDWWRLRKKQTLGPRPELVNEMKAESGGRLFMQQPRSFLEKAAELLQVDVDEGTLEDVERVATTRARSAEWTPEAVEELFARLTDAHREKVIKAAAHNGGHVSREEVYELGGLPESRSLTGFTRPILRMTRELRDEGLLAEDAGELFYAVYEDPDSPSRASGFKIPQSALGAVVAAVGDAGDDHSDGG